MPHQWSRTVSGYRLASASVVLCLLMSAALAQPPDTPFLRIEAGMHTAHIWRIDVDAQARFLVTASHDKTARVWSLASGELLKVLRPPWVQAKRVRSMPWRSLRTAGRSRRRGRPAGRGIIKLHLSLRPCQRPVAAANLGPAQRHLSPRLFSGWAHLAAALGGDNGIRVYETRDYGEIARDVDYGDRSSWVEFDRHGRLVTSSYDGYVRLYDARSSASPNGKRQAASGRSRCASRPTAPWWRSGLTIPRR